MIAKHVPIRSLGKSDFASLVRYITDAQSKEHRLGYVRVSNCEAYGLRDAITEVLATQFQNTRAESDKTYHLIVSFRAGEQLSVETLQAIEDRICTGLGYAEHQRISAVHNDTDNLHVHIAINKIHPARHTIHEPYYPHRKLADLCVVLERDFHLEHDNHEPRQSGSASRAADMERHSGIESLAGWIKRECLVEIRGAESWEELHRVMGRNGLKLRTRGNGLVIQSEDGTTIKASTLSRDLSKPVLEGKLGIFEHSPQSAEKESARRSYRKDPVRLRIDTSELFARYRDEQRGLASTRSQALADAKRLKDLAIDNAKRVGKVRRVAIKLMGGSGLTKRLLYAQASAALQSDLETVRRNYDRERAVLYQNFRRRSWADWLRQEALKGNSKALDVLRARNPAQATSGNTLAGHGETRALQANDIDNITKKGTIIFRSGRTAIRDDGQQLRVSREIDRSGARAALHMATERFGQSIAVTGSPEFKALMIRAAVDTQLPIAFSDPSLETRRQALMNQIRKPGIPPVGHRPPPHLRDGLITLNQLGVLSMNEGSGRLTATSEQQQATISKLDQRRMKLSAELESRKAKSQSKAKGRGI